MLKLDSAVEDNPATKTRFGSGTITGTPSSASSTGRAINSMDAQKSGIDAGKSASAEGASLSRLVVGPNIKLKGAEIDDCDTLVIEGHVEASMTSRVVEIAEKGVYNGTATMDVAEIWGRFDGDLTVRQELVIHATGRVSGNITYRKIRIEEGGELCGTVNTMSK